LFGVEMEKFKFKVGEHVKLKFSGRVGVVTWNDRIECLNKNLYQVLWSGDTEVEREPVMEGSEIHGNKCYSEESFLANTTGN